jgi:hypothetical protein
MLLSSTIDTFLDHDPRRRATLLAGLSLVIILHPVAWMEDALRDYDGGMSKPTAISARSVIAGG